MIEVICNDRLGKKGRVKVNEDDTIGDLKKLIAAQVSKRRARRSHNPKPFHSLLFSPAPPLTPRRQRQVGTRPEKIRIQKWYTVFKDHITLEDYEIHDGMGLEMYYN